MPAHDRGRVAAHPLHTLVSENGVCKGWAATWQQQKLDPRVASMARGSLTEAIAVATMMYACGLVSQYYQQNLERYPVARRTVEIPAQLLDLVTPPFYCVV